MIKDSYKAWVLADQSDQGGIVTPSRKEERKSKNRERRYKLVSALKKRVREEKVRMTEM